MEGAPSAPLSIDSSQVPARMPSDSPLPKQIGRFQIRARLGAGAFGTVYRAFNPQLKREAALKVPHAGTLEIPRAIERFLRAAKAVARLRHPHIVAFYDAAQDGNSPYVAAAFIEGRSMDDAIAKAFTEFIDKAEGK